MAERSFKEEVEKLKLGDGDEFHGEGILAVTKALLQSGVSYVAGYQGAPISHLMDVMADANEILEGLGVHFENSASEATAAPARYANRRRVNFMSALTGHRGDAVATLPAPTANLPATGSSSPDRRSRTIDARRRSRGQRVRQAAPKSRNPGSPIASCGPA